MTGRLIPAVAPGRYGKRLGDPGLYVRECMSGSLASLSAWRDQSSKLQEEVFREFGLQLPTRPRVANSNNLTFVWNGPDRWMVEAEDMSEGIELLLGKSLRPFAAICNQSDGYVRFDVQGGRVRDTLAKGLPIDLDSERFLLGDVAITAVAHIGVHLWQTSGSPNYRLCVSRSYAKSFWGWLHKSSAEFGCEVW